VLVLAVAVTVMAVAWTGWKALRDLEVEGQMGEVHPELGARRPRLRLVEPAGVTAS
jgi:hypothetical protein